VRLEIPWACLVWPTCCWAPILLLPLPWEVIFREAPGGGAQGNVFFGVLGYKPGRVPRRTLLRLSTPASTDAQLVPKGC